MNTSIPHGVLVSGNALVSATTPVSGATLVSRRVRRGRVARPQSGRSTRWVAVVGIGLWLGMAAPAEAQERTAWAEAGIGFLSVLASAVYGPVKVIYAGAGAVTAGFAYALSGGQPELSQVLLARSLRGDYLVTTEHLTGNRQLVFVGRDPILEPPLEPQVGEPYPY